MTEIEIGKIENFGQLLKKRRVELGYFQKDIAVAVGVAVSTVNNWEKNVNYPLCDKFVLLCNFLKVPYSYFLGESHFGDLSDEEKSLLKLYRSLSEKDKVFVTSVMMHEAQK